MAKPVGLSQPPCHTRPCPTSRTVTTHQGSEGPSLRKRTVRNENTGLDALLKRLDSVGDAAAVRRSGAAEHLLQTYLGARICERFLTILGEHMIGDRHGYESLQPEPLPPERPRLLRLKEHLQDLVPSAIRSARERFERKRPA